MTRFNLWRKLASGLLTGVMAFLLVACGGPSAETASDFALEVTEAMYDGDINPMLDNLDYSSFKTSKQREQARKLAEGKLNNMLVKNLKQISQHGGIDNIQVTGVSFLKEVYQVNMKVTFEDKRTRTEKLKVRWSDDLDQFVIVQ